MGGSHGCDAGLDCFVEYVHTLETFLYLVVVHVVVAVLSEKWIFVDGWPMYNSSCSSRLPSRVSQILTVSPRDTSPC